MWCRVLRSRFSIYDWNVLTCFYMRKFVNFHKFLFYISKIKSTYGLPQSCIVVVSTNIYWYEVSPVRDDYIYVFTKKVKYAQAWFASFLG